MRFSTLQNAFFLALLVLTTLAFLGLIQDFLLPIFWATVLAVFFRPLHERWFDMCGGRATLASVLTIATIIVVVIAPLVLVGMAVAQESVAVYERVASGEIDVREPVRALERLAPVAADYLEQLGVSLEKIKQNLSGAAVAASQFVASRALEFGRNALRVTVLFFVMLYVLFFFVRDGEDMVEGAIRVLPLGNERERRLFGKFAEVARATIKGTVVVGVVQGALGGVAFWILGLPAAVLWGVIMTLLSLLPAVGSVVVWGPAALILLVTGEVARGVILLAIGALLIGLVDNVLRPILVGRDTQIPDFLILIATLGGLTVFGLSGFVIGPIIAAFFLVVWDMFAEEFGDAEDAPETATDEITPAPAEAPPNDAA
jgi:predicted PurR-regulated permease PerM